MMFRVILCVQFYRLMQLIFSTLLNKQSTWTIIINSSFAFAKHHSSSLLAVKASPSPEGRDLARG